MLKRLYFFVCKYEESTFIPNPSPSFAVLGQISPGQLPPGQCPLDNCHLRQLPAGKLTPGQFPPRKVAPQATPT